MVITAANIIADPTFNSNFIIITAIKFTIQVNIITIATNKKATVNFIIIASYFIIFITVIMHINLINCYIIDYS